MCLNGRTIWCNLLKAIKSCCIMVDREKNHLSDEEIVYAIVNTKMTGLFGILYDRYAQKVYHKCLSFSKNKQEAEDLSHDVFIRVYIKLRTFENRSKFSTWLYSLTYNFCLNYINRDKKKREEIEAVGAEIYAYTRDEYNDRFILTLKTDKLKIAMNSIDPENRAILLMKYLDDFSIKDICESLDIGESAAKMRLARAKKKLVDSYNQIGS